MLDACFAGSATSRAKLKVGGMDSELHSCPINKRGSISRAPFVLLMRFWDTHERSHAATLVRPSRCHVQLRAQADFVEVLSLANIISRDLLETRLGRFSLPAHGQPGQAATGLLLL